jgi:S1-C subfamily serine protease
VQAGWLGVSGRSIAELPDADLLVLGLQRRAGVIVRDVTPESAAARAGLLTGDVIIRVDDLDIAGTADLGALLSSLPAGQAIKLRAIRDHQPLELSAVLGARPNGEQRNMMAGFTSGLEPDLSERDQLEKRLDELQNRFRSYQKSTPSRETREALRELEIEIRRIHDDLRALGPANTGPPPRDAAARPEYPAADLTAEQQIREITFQAGFTARELTPQLAAILYASGGVLVSKVAKDSPAERAGLKAGDVIVGTQERSVGNISQLKTILAAQRGAITLKIVRTREPIVVSLNIQ